MLKKDTSFYREWFERRLKVASDVVAHGEAFEVDAEILLCCAISALAARAWPEHQDRARFTELLVRFAPPNADMKRVCVPKLLGELRAKGDIESTRVLRAKCYPDNPSQIVTGHGLDQDEMEITRELPKVDRTLLRKCSYAHIIYKDLRCGLIHEYTLPHKDIDGYTLPHEVIDISIPDNATAPIYVNLRDRMTGSTERLLHFPYTWLSTALAEAAENVFGFWDKSQSEQMAPPAHWWIDGKTEDGPSR